MPKTLNDCLDWAGEFAADSVYTGHAANTQQAAKHIQTIRMVQSKQPVSAARAKNALRWAIRICRKTADTEKVDRVFRSMLKASEKLLAAA